jgi:hypothetical protein
LPIVDEIKSWKLEGRRQKAEGRRQRTDVRGRKTEDGRQDGCQKTDVRRRRLIAQRVQLGEEI